MSLDFPTEGWEGKCFVQEHLDIAAASDIIQYRLSDDGNCRLIESSTAGSCPIKPKVVKGWGPGPSCMTGNMIFICSNILGLAQLLDKVSNSGAQVRIMKGPMTV